jgi:5-(carboxyamino)imidazole ribonucleotide synthase
MGYDGKGQYIIRQPQDSLSAWESLSGQALILEKYVAFDFEVSQIAVRSREGEIKFYPLIKNYHREGILLLSLAPYEDADLSAKAQQYVAALMNRLDYVGILTVEFFVKDAQLYANEMAPRVHNSGHWTIEGAVISQFENHLRAITGLALGSTQSRAYSAMINLIGTLPNKKELLQKFPKLHWHEYGKAARQKRKLGHLTLCNRDKQNLMSQVYEILQMMNISEPEVFEL